MRGVEISVVETQGALAEEVVGANLLPPARRPADDEQDEGARDPQVVVGGDDQIVDVAAGHDVVDRQRTGDGDHAHEGHTGNGAAIAHGRRPQRLRGDPPLPAHLSHLLAPGQHVQPIAAAQARRHQPSGVEQVVGFG